MLSLLPKTLIRSNWELIEKEPPVNARFCVSASLPSTLAWFVFTKISWPESFVILLIEFEYSGKVAFNLSCGKKRAW